MKQRILGILAALVVVIIFTNATLESASPCDSPLVGGHTSAPGESGCNGCHAGIQNAGTAIIDFNLGSGTYVPGQTYTGFVRIQQSGMQKFGFAALALTNIGNNTTGSFGLIEPDRTRIYADGNRNYVSHTPCSADSVDVDSWSFTWTAPETDVDTVTIYLGALAANHNHATSGDYSYNRKIVLAPQTGTLITEYENSLTLFPNPFTNKINIQGIRASSKVTIAIIDLTGKLLFAENIKNTADIFSFELDNKILPGCYFLKITAGSQVAIKRVVKF